MASIRNDLPTLEQVLARKTQPPVCLYNLYIIMRDRLHMEEVLDFYLDVQHHQLLWRRYVKSMRRSGYLTEEDLADGFQSPRVVSRLSQVGSLDEKKATSPLSSTTTLDKQQRGRLQIPGGGRIEEDLQSEDMSVPLERPPLGDDDDDPSNNNNNNTVRHAMREKAMLNRRDLTESAQRILMKYLVPAASKELTQLPPELKHTMRREIEQGGRDDPLVFQDAKDYLFEYMRRTAYPKFLRLKVWGNLTLWQQLGRLVVGLVSLLAAFATAFSLIFLDYPPWGTRFWVCIDYTL